MEAIADQISNQKARYGWSEASFTTSWSNSPQRTQFYLGRPQYYSDQINYQTYSLVNPQPVTSDMYAAGSSALNGKFFTMTSFEGIYKGVGNVYTDTGAMGTLLDTYQLSIAVGAIAACVVANDASAYPSNGFKDGYKYVAVVT